MYKLIIVTKIITKNFIYIYIYFILNENYILILKYNSFLIIYKLKKLNKVYV